MKTAIVILLLASCIFASARDSGKEGSSKDHQEKDKGGEDKEGHWHTHREVELHYDEKTIAFQSEMKNESARTKDKIEFDLRSEGSSPMRFRYEYKHEAADAESELSVRVVYTAIIEYAEAGGVFDGYDDGKDTLVQRIDFDTKSWLPIAKPATEAIPGGGNKYTFDVKYATGVFAMKIFFGDAPFSAGGWVFTPVQVKVDIIIADFPYKRNDTYLALVCMVKGSDDIERKHQDAEGDDQDRIVAVDTAFAFGWNRTVEADGVAASVVATDLAPSFKPALKGDAGKGGESGAESDAGEEDDKGADYWKQTYYSFSAPHAKKLVWDPYMGVENGVASLAASLAALLVAAAAALL